MRPYLSKEITKRIQAFPCCYKNVSALLKIKLGILNYLSFAFTGVKSKRGF